MADSVVWNPIPTYEAAFVPKTGRGMRHWDKDGPRDPDNDVVPPLRGPVRVFEWRGPRLACVTCNVAD